jgi:hypothetical protein
LAGNTPVVGTMMDLVSPIKMANQPDFSQVGATPPLKYVDTRFGTKVIMGCHLLSTKSIYRNLFVHPELEAWVERQKPQTQDKFRKVSAVVLSDTNFWKNLDMCSRIFKSRCKLCVSTTT